LEWGDNFEEKTKEIGVIPVGPERTELKGVRWEKGSLKRGKRWVQNEIGR